MPDIDLTKFLTAGREALPHFEAITDNSTLVYPNNLTAQEGPVASLFIGMADEYNSTGDWESVLTAHQSELDEISNHLLGIADSWLAAGNALAEIWPNNPIVIFGPYLILAAFAAGAIVIVTSSSQVKIDRAVSMGAAAGFLYSNLTGNNGAISGELSNRVPDFASQLTVISSM